MGTTFRLYLPLLGELREKLETAPAIILQVGGSEMILLVEDDTDVQVSLQRLLEAFGYHVLAFGDSDEAIEAFRGQSDEIDLIILDVIMPGKSGIVVLDEMLRIKPSVKSLFLSGYPADFLRKKGVHADNFNLVMKPVIPAELAARIRAVISA